MDLKEWNQNEAAQLELSKFIKSKVWEDVKELVRQNINTESGIFLEGSATAIEMAALKASQINGRDKTIEYIERLTSASTAPKQLPKPFSHLRP